MYLHLTYLLLINTNFGYSRHFTFFHIYQMWSDTHIKLMTAAGISHSAACVSSKIFQGIQLTISLRHSILLHMRSISQLYPSHCDPIDWSPSGFSVHGIFQERPRDWIHVSLTADRFIAIWAMHTLFHVSNELAPVISTTIHSHILVSLTSDHNFYFSLPSPSPTYKP